MGFRKVSLCSSWYSSSPSWQAIWSNTARAQTRLKSVSKDYFIDLRNMDDGIEFSGWKIKHNIERLSGRTMCRLPEAVSLEEEICSGAHKPISPNPCFLQIGRNVFCETGAGSQTVMDWIGGAAWMLWSCSAHQVQECNSGACGAGGAGVEEGGASREPMS